MSSSEDAPISPKLDVLPRENLSLWKESLEAAALAYCASHGPDGALGLACDAASWQARHPGAVVARPVYPDPGVLAGAATPAERQAHATALVRFRDFSTAAAKLRKLALESIGETNLDAIRDANLRLHHVTANSIIVSMDTLHGTFTEADINAFLEALNAKLKSVTGFDAHNATFNKTLAKLLRAGSPVGPFAAYRSYVATLSGFPAFEKHVDNYVTATPVATTRRVADLITSLRVHIPTIELKSMKSAPFSGAAVNLPAFSGNVGANIHHGTGLTRNQLLAALSEMPKKSPRRPQSQQPRRRIPGHLRDHPAWHDLLSPPRPQHVPRLGERA